MDALDFEAEAGEEKAEAAGGSRRIQRGILIGFCLTIDAAIVAWALLPLTGI